MAPLGPRLLLRRRGVSLEWWFLLGTLIWFAPSALADRQAYRTAYGCEGATLSIACETGHVINVIRANYGRFSITICNTHGNTEWSVNCQSPRTHRVLAESCSGKPSCTIEASTGNFGDGCPGTHKYLEAHYQCLSVTTSTTTARPRPPWFIATRDIVWLAPTPNSSSSAVPSSETSLLSTSALRESSPYFPSSTTPSPTHHSPVNFRSTTVTTTTTTTTTTSSTRSPTTQTTSPVSTTSTGTNPYSPFFPEIDRKHVEGNQNSADGSDSSSHLPISTSAIVPSRTLPVTPPSFVSGTNYDIPWCSPSFARGLYWNWTKSGEVVELACPGGATGLARRTCHAGEWEGPADLSDCRSAWLMALRKRARPNAQDSVLSVATDLAKVTASKALYGGDLITAAQLIKTLSRRMMQDVAVAFPEPNQRKALITEFLLAALETGSALLSAGMMGPWGDLSSKERRFAVTELMVGLEEATFLLGDVLPEDTEAVLFKSHILASARSILPDGSAVKFPSLEDEMMDWVFTDSVLLPPEVMYENSKGRSSRVIFLAYRHLEDLLSPLGSSLGKHKRKNVSRIVNSRVVSASLGFGKHIQLSELSKSVTVTFSLLRQENVSNPVCAFWDYSTFDWSEEGCYVHTSNRSHVSCKCNHLTNFAVIMEESKGAEPAGGGSPVRILAFVGCLTCVVCIAGAILMFALFKGLASLRTYIQRHICICLLLAEVTFLIGVWRTDHPVFCGVIAGVLHYSILAAFCWMFVEGVHVYISISKLVEGDSLHLRWWHYLLAYGAPLFVVCGAAVVDPFSFGTPQYCWLRIDNFFIFALAGPALTLALLEAILLVFALLKTCGFNMDEGLKTKEITRLSSSRCWLRNALLLLLLMVLTWTLGLLLLHEPSVAVASVFCAFSILQGVLTFIFYCLRNQRIREWCSYPGQEGSVWIPQLFRSVFATEKQTYSPNNNNNNMTTTTSSSLAPDLSSSSASSTSSSHHHANHTAMHQYLPSLRHVGTAKNLMNQHPSAPPFPGNTSLMGSRSSLRQLGSMGYPLPMGNLHQSLPRHRLPPSIPTATSTTTHLGPNSLSAPLTVDEDVSYKSFSRDSGHGGSEQEDSPRTPWNGPHHSYHSTLCNDPKSNYISKMNSLNKAKVEAHCNMPYNYTLALSPNVALTPTIAAMLRAGGGRSRSPWNHTYVEIETDPMYEEVERGRWARIGSEAVQVSDLSDEDLKRGTPSDVSRQSSRNYGDLRPLLPYIQQQQRRTVESQFSLSEERLRDFNAAQMSRDLEQLQKVKRQLSRENLMTVAVLNGEQVVCRLSSPPNTPVSPNLPIIQEGGHTQIANGYPANFMVSPTHLVYSRECNEC